MSSRRVVLMTVCMVLFLPSNPFLPPCATTSSTVGPVPDDGLHVAIPNQWVEPSAFSKTSMVNWYKPAKGASKMPVLGSKASLVSRSSLLKMIGAGSAVENQCNFTYALTRKRKRDAELP